VKLVLIGSRERFEEMARSDAVFRKSFGVRADFRSDTPRTAEAERTFARVAAAVSRKAGLPAVDADGLAALVETGAELAGRRDRLTTSFAAVERVLQEAAFRARGRDAGTIGRPDVEAARQAQARRDDHDPDPRAVSRLLSVDDVGAGRVLTLEPVAPGSVANGGVLRVTVAARAADPGGTRVVRVGTGARPAPDAGVLLLEAWIGHRFPGLALTVTVVAEGAHGLEELPPAAATAAEAVALVSALAGLPADPSTAVVGALAPDGTVGTAGGLGDRLRVFHDLLRRAGDTQPRAVVVPAVEAGSLMLPAALVADAAAGRFGVHAVSRIDQAVELVLGVGPEEVDARVAERLAGRTPAAV
jgi:predicted ATP-dependent protease